MHIPPFENNNRPIVDKNDSKVPLNYFNIVKLEKDQSFEYIIPGYETCIVPATGTIDVNVEGENYNSIGNLWCFIAPTIILLFLIFLKFGRSQRIDHKG